MLPMLAMLQQQLGGGGVRGQESGLEGRWLEEFSLTVAWVRVRITVLVRVSCWIR